VFETNHPITQYSNQSTNEDVILWVEGFFVPVEDMASED